MRRRHICHPRAGLYAHFLLASLLAASAASGAPPPDLDAYVARALKQFEVPGMAVAVVENGRTSLARGYGLRKLGSPQRVDERTLFSIASCGKAFTTAALAILVDEGKLDWDDKVTKRLPGFALYDDRATLEMRIRDLLIHNSGLPEGGGEILISPATDFTRREIVERMRFIKPRTSFRSAYAYSNLAYVAAGRVIEETAGVSWEVFVQRRLFEPLGMRDSIPSPEMLKTDNVGWPHGRLAGPMRDMGPVAPLPGNIVKPDNAGPAGSIMVSAADMTRWLQLQLDRGAVPGGGRLFSEAAGREMWTPQIIQPPDPAAQAIAAATAFDFETYAFGWEILSYRGHKVVRHTGAIDGYRAVVMLIPQKKVAFAVMINSDNGEARWAVHYYLLEHFLGIKPTDWIDLYAQARDEQLAANVAALQKQSAITTPGPGPSLEPARYAGAYHDDLYGTVTITAAGEELNIRFDRTPNMSSRLEHVRYDTFRTRFVDRTMPDAFVTFTIGLDGSIVRMTMLDASPLGDPGVGYSELKLMPVSGS